MSKTLSQIVNSMNNVNHMSSNLKVRGQIFEFFNDRPNQFLQELITLFKNNSLQRRQQAMFLLNEVSKPPLNLGQIRQDVILQCVISLFEAIFNQNRDFNCSLKFKAIGIFLSKYAPQSALNSVCEQIKEKRHVQKWLVALTQFLSRIKIAKQNVYQLTINLIDYIIQDQSPYSQSQIDEIFNTFTQLAKNSFASDSLHKAYIEYQHFHQLVRKLIQLIKRFGQFQFRNKFLIFSEICEIGKINTNLTMIMNLFDNTQEFLSWSSDIVQIWIDIINRLDLKYLLENPSDKYQVKTLFDNLATNMIENIKKLDSQFINNGTPVIRDKTLSQNSFIKSLAYPSAQLLILLVNKMSLKNIEQIIVNQINIVPTFYRSLSYQLLQSVYYCCSTNYNIKGSQLIALSQNIFKKYSKSCNLLEMVQPQIYDEEVIKTILFSITNILENRHKVFSQNAPYFFGRIYLFIMNISKFKLHSLTIDRIRSALEVIMEYGKQYLIGKGRLNQLKEIVTHFVLRSSPTQSEKSIKDIVVSYGIDLAYSKFVSRNQKLELLKQFTKIFYIGQVFNKSDIDNISKFVSNLVISLQGFDQSNIDENRSLTQLLQWLIFSIERFIQPAIFLPLKQVLLFNTQFATKIISMNFKRIEKCSKLYPVVYIPVTLELLKSENTLTPENKAGMRNQLFDIFICELGEQKYEFQRIKKVFQNLQQAVQLQIFEGRQRELLQTLFLSFIFINKIDSKPQNKIMLKSILLKLLKQYFISSTRLPHLDIKFYIQFLEQQHDFLSLLKFAYFPFQLQFKILVLQLNHQIMSHFPGDTSLIQNLSKHNASISCSLPLQVFKNQIKQDQLQELTQSIVHCLDAILMHK